MASATEWNYRWALVPDLWRKFKRHIEEHAHTCGVQGRKMLVEKVRQQSYETQMALRRRTCLGSSAKCN
jgi:hypothetical protein